MTQLRRPRPNLSCRRRLVRCCRRQRQMVVPRLVVPTWLTTAQPCWRPCLQACVHAIATDLFKLAAPTRVQAAAWPPAAAGKDVLALAPPGAGKTLAYLVPVAAEVLGKGDGSGRRTHTTTTSSTTSLTAVILVPTRELARQVYRDAAPLRSLARCACVYGGASRGDQVERLAGGGVRLLVATPGRLLDLVEDGVVSLGK